MKSSFGKRLVAYFIDIILVSMVLSIVTIAIPNSKSLVNLNKELENTSNDYVEKVITSDIYVNKVTDISYDISIQSALSNIIDVTITMLYFIVFQYYNKGQTFGKKFMKIKVKGYDDRKLSINDYIFRAMIVNSIFFNLVNIVMLFFCKKSVYFYGNLVITGLQFIVLLVSIIMIMFRDDGRGLQDIAGHSKVVDV